MSEMAQCKICGKILHNDEVGLNRKLINRNAEEFLCIFCMAKQFRCTPELLNEKIRQFRRLGCALFTSEEEPT